MKVHLSKRVNLLPFGVARISAPLCGSGDGGSFFGTRKPEKVTCKRCLAKMKKRGEVK